MSLKDAEIRAFRAGDTRYKRADEKGLYIEVYPNGSKLWRFKFRVGDKEKKLALGAYPEISLAQARKLRDAERAKISDGVDPALERKRAKLTKQLDAANTFETVATEYIDTKMVGEGRAQPTVDKARWFLSLLRPAIGSMPITDVDPQMLLAALKRLEGKGNFETAKRCRSFASRVFRYGVWTGRCKADPSSLLQGALISKQARHHAAILDPIKLGDLLRAIDTFDGSPITRFALKIAPHVFVRPGELRHAEWSEIDLDAAVWQIPEGRMKMRRAHVEPLSRQVVQMLAEWGDVLGREGYVFPSLYSSARPMSENTVNAAFRRMGFGKDEITGHGLRTTASTLLNESGLWQPDAIERALSHREKDAVRGAYNRGQYWDERVKMAQWWSDHLDKLQAGGQVIRIDSHRIQI